MRSFLWPDIKERVEKNWPTLSAFQQHVLTTKLGGCAGTFRNVPITIPLTKVLMSFLMLHFHYRRGAATALAAMRQRISSKPKLIFQVKLQTCRLKSNVEIIVTSMGYVAKYEPTSNQNMHTGESANTLE